MTGRPRTSAVRWVVAALMGVVVAGSWWLMMRGARAALFFEPTTEALARAVGGRRDGLASALVLVAAAVVLALVARRVWLVPLALPGVVVGAALALAPDSAAFLFGVFATAVAILLVVVAAIVTRAGIRPPLS